MIINESAEEKLIHRLEALKAAPDSTKYIYFHLMGIPSVDSIKDKIIKSTQQHISSEELQIYLCEDGDVCILSPSIVNKNANEFIDEIAAYAKKLPNSDFVEFYEIKRQINKILFILEQKQEKNLKAEKITLQEKEKQRAANKKREILSDVTLAKKGDIHERRKKRYSPQFMMIEDDAFSRRLVENVFQKQFPLTALPNADQAISTYITLAPDVLFLDIDLPNISGHELLEKIIEIDPEAYVIMLSGNSDQANIMQAMTHGAKGFVAKPFTREKLFQYISRCPTIKIPAIKLNTKG